jgi:hypothetical protein
MNIFRTEPPHLHSKTWRRQGEREIFRALQLSCEQQQHRLQGVAPLPRRHLQHIALLLCLAGIRPTQQE